MQNNPAPDPHQTTGKEFTALFSHIFLRCTQAHSEAFWRPLWRWRRRLLACPKAGFSLDLDSTVFCREGSQEGAAKGFNPRHSSIAVTRWGNRASSASFSPIRVQ